MTLSGDFFGDFTSLSGLTGLVKTSTFIFGFLAAFIIRAGLDYNYGEGDYFITDLRRLCSSLLRYFSKQLSSSFDNSGIALTSDSNSFMLLR